MSFTRVKALNQIEKKLKAGWVQGTYEQDNADGSKSFCLEGALNSLDCGRRFRDGAEALIEKVIQTKTNGETSSLIGYNDTTGRTKDEVLEVVRTARRLAQSDVAKRSVRNLKRTRRQTTK